MDPISLTDLARDQLVLAHDASAGRSAKTVYGGHEHALRQSFDEIRRHSVSVCV